MTSIPTEASEARSYTPPSLANIPNAPVFTLKAATRRDRRDHRHMLRKERLRYHSPAAARLEMLRAIHAQWSPDLVAEHEPRLKQFWDAVDQHEKRQEGKAEKAPFDHPDQAAVNALTKQVMDAWPPLAEMDADNIRFFELSPILMACCVISGWQNVDVPFALAAGHVVLDAMEDVGEWLGDLEERHIDEVAGVLPRGSAFMQLTAECSALLYLTKEEEKNSD